ncbi:MAG: hypothetical protein H7Y22_03240 [Gemmatimonadaceae bacterium]|nr:hypothetical protein [Gloeobacterales cyanobacterium ES-bin-141]
MQPIHKTIDRDSVAAPEEKYTLKREFGRAWEWVVFVWRLGRRLGGFRAIIRTVFLIVSLLVRRTLVQWGWLRQ